MNTTPKKNMLYNNLLVILLGSLLSLTCTHKLSWDSSNQNHGSSYPPHIPKDTTQLVIWKNPDSSNASFQQWITAHFNNNTVTEKYFCPNCDSTLLLISGPGPALFIQTVSGGSTGKKIPGVSGGDGPAYFSTNISIYFFDSAYETIQVQTKQLSKKHPKKKSVTVAVFDTGVDADGIVYNNNLYRNAILSCLGPNANNGWNFSNNNNDIHDNHIQKHGTTVSRFIVDQVCQYGENGVKILPVKLFDSAGGSNLFDVLCAIAYAKNRGAKIINASFGYYAPKTIVRNGVEMPDSSGYLLKKFIEYYLTLNNILLIAAAGNMDDLHERAVFVSNGLPLPSNMRSLDMVNFYPASFASELNNVVAVTTVNHMGRVSPQQNFSSQVVDIGVFADRDNDFVFQNPIHTTHSVVGTSFATPIVTGKICAFYHKIEALLNTGTFSKDIMLDNLGAGIVHHDTQLSGKIRPGERVMSKSF